MPGILDIFASLRAITLQPYLIQTLVQCAESAINTVNFNNLLPSRASGSDH